MEFTGRASLLAALFFIIKIQHENSCFIRIKQFCDEEEILGEIKYKLACF